MKAQYKFASVAAAGILITAFVSIFSLMDFANHGSIESKKSYVTQMRRAVRVIVENKNDQLADRLASAVEIEAATADKKNSLTAADFVGVGLASFAGSNWSIDWFKSNNEELNHDWIDGLLRDLPFKRAQQNEITWSRVATRDGQVYFLLMASIQVKVGASEQERISIGVLPTSIFSDVNMISKGQNESVFVVDDQGYAYSYPDQQYVGAKIDSHPLVAQLIKDASAESVQIFQDSAGNSSVGGFEPVGQSNIYVIATVPQGGSPMGNAIGKILLMALAMMLVAGVAILILHKHSTLQIASLEKNLKLAQTGAPAERISTPASAENSREFAKSVAEYLRVPISALIGYVQIAEHRSKDGEVNEILKKLTGEARKLRDFLNSVKKVTEMNEPKTEALDLTPLCNQVVSIFRKDMTQKQIQFAENIKADLAIRGDYESLKSSLKTLFTFAIHFVSSGRNQRKIVFSIERTGGFAHVIIEGYGAELSAEKRRQIFTPFQTELPESQILSLDLALAQSRVAELNGEINVESLGYDGMKLTVRIPTLTLERQPEPEIVNVNEMPPPPPPSVTVSEVAMDSAKVKLTIQDEKKSSNGKVRFDI